MSEIPGSEQTRPRWYLVGALPEDLRTAHLMTRSGDMRYRRSACGALQSRSWHPVEVDVPLCALCAATLDQVEGEQLALDLRVG